LQSNKKIIRTLFGQIKTIYIQPNPLFKVFESVKLKNIIINKNNIPISDKYIFGGNKRIHGYLTTANMNH